MRRILAISVVLLFSQFLYAQKPYVTWSVRLPACATEQTGFYLDSIKKLGIRQVILDVAFISNFQKNPGALKVILQNAKMKTVVLNAGVLESPVSEKFEKDWNAQVQFAHDIGAKYILVQGRKRDAYPPGKDVLEKWGQALEAYIQTSKKYSVQMLVENRLHTICQTEEEVNWLVSSIKSKKINVLLQPAHLVQLGQNPGSVLRTHKRKITFLALQGLVSPLPKYQGPKAYNYQLTGIEVPGKFDIPFWMSECRLAGFRKSMVLEVQGAKDSATFFASLTRQLQYLKNQFGYAF